MSGRGDDDAARTEAGGLCVPTFGLGPSTTLVDAVPTRSRFGSDSISMRFRARARRDPNSLAESPRTARQMRILRVAQHLYPDTKGGGQVLCGQPGRDTPLLQSFLDEAGVLSSSRCHLFAAREQLDDQMHEQTHHRFIRSEGSRPLVRRGLAALLCRRRRARGRLRARRVPCRERLPVRTRSKCRRLGPDCTRVDSGRRASRVR